MIVSDSRKDLHDFTHTVACMVIPDNDFGKLMWYCLLCDMRLGSTDETGMSKYLAALLAKIGSCRVSKINSTTPKFVRSFA